MPGNKKKMKKMKKKMVQGTLGFTKKEMIREQM